MTKSERIFWCCVTGYIAMFIICFGPATVESQKARDEWLAECKASNPALSCALGPSPSDGLFKAAFWPLWLSYVAAKDKK
jgi:hypothetical protein